MGDQQLPGATPDVKEREDNEVKEPDMYRVILHNDDYTTMEFVVEVIVKVFNKSVDAAMGIMLDVHHKGRGDAGTFTRDIASTKVEVVRKMARNREFPLRCTMERA